MSTLDTKKVVLRFLDMGTNYLIISPNVSIEPVVGGFAVLVHGFQWTSQETIDAGEQESVYFKPEEAWQAYADANPDMPNLNDMACQMVGDGKKPNLYFVTIDGKTVAASEDFNRAVDVAERMAGSDTPALVEDRETGVVWENDASERRQCEPEENECTDGARHTLDAERAEVAKGASSDPKALVIDVWCKVCGRSGSVTIDPDDVMW